VFAYCYYSTSSLSNLNHLIILEKNVVESYLESNDASGYSN